MKALLVVGGLAGAIVLGIFAEDIIALMPVRWQSWGLWLLSAMYCGALLLLCWYVFGIFEEVPKHQSVLDEGFRTVQRPLQPSPPQKTVPHPEPVEEPVS